MGGGGEEKGRGDKNKNGDWEEGRERKRNGLREIKRKGERE